MPTSTTEATPALPGYLRLLRALRRRVLPTPPRPVILMYHRVAASECDPWDLAVAPERFARQLDFLSKERVVLSLASLVRLHEAGAAPPEAVAITFDDGYACNALTAAPLLEARGLPATFFLATGSIGSEREYWWDELERILAAAKGDLTVEIDGVKISLDLGEQSDGADLQRTAYRGGTPRKAPERAMERLWEAMQGVEGARRAAILDRMRVAAGIAPKARGSHRPMTRAEAQALAGRPFVEIGAHTVSHPALSRLSIAEQKREIEGSRDACLALTGRLPTSFSYPHGDFGAETIELVREAGFALACSTKARPLRKDADRFTLGRLHVSDLEPDDFGRLLDAVSRGLPRPAPRGAVQMREATAR